jgi:hypothetical protein
MRAQPGGSPRGASNAAFRKRKAIEHSVGTSLSAKCERNTGNPTVIWLQLGDWHAGD